MEAKKEKKNLGKIQWETVSALLSCVLEGTRSQVQNERDVIFDVSENFTREWFEVPK